MKLTSIYSFIVFLILFLPTMSIAQGIYDPRTGQVIDQRGMAESMRQGATGQRSRNSRPPSGTDRYNFTFDDETGAANLNIDGMEDPFGRTPQPRNLQPLPYYDGPDLQGAQQKCPRGGVAILGQCP